MADNKQITITAELKQKHKLKSFTQNIKYDVVATRNIVDYKLPKVEGNYQKKEVYLVINDAGLEVMLDATWFN